MGFSTESSGTGKRYHSPKYVGAPRSRSAKGEACGN
jgi:hypothetical protein